MQRRGTSSARPTLPPERAWNRTNMSCPASACLAPARLGVDRHVCVDRHDADNALWRGSAYVCGMRLAIRLRKGAHNVRTRDERHVARVGRGSGGMRSPDRAETWRAPNASFDEANATTGCVRISVGSEARRHTRHAILDEDLSDGCRSALRRGDPLGSGRSRALGAGTASSPSGRGGLQSLGRNANFVVIHHCAALNRDAAARAAARCRRLPCGVRGGG